MRLDEARWRPRKIELRLATIKNGVEILVVVLALLDCGGRVFGEKLRPHTFRIIRLRESPGDDRRQFVRSVEREERQAVEVAPVARHGEKLAQELLLLLRREVAHHVVDSGREPPDSGFGTRVARIPGAKEGASADNFG